MDTVEAKIAIVDCERLAAGSKSIDLRPFKSLLAIYLLHGENSDDQLEILYDADICDIYNVFLDSPSGKVSNPHRSLDRPKISVLLLVLGIDL